LALDTVFNREMLENKRSMFFDKNKRDFSEKINELEKKYEELIKKNSSYKFPKKYDWEFISKQYLKVFHVLTNYQSM